MGNIAEALAEKRAKMAPPRRVNQIEAEVHVGYVHVSFDLAEIETEVLRDELAQRSIEAFGSEPDEAHLQHIHTLFKTGRRDEASDLCERMVADMLGRAI